MEHALDAGAHDIVVTADSIDVMTTLENLGWFRILKEAGIESISAEMIMLASNEIDLNLSDAEKLLKLIEHLEDLDEAKCFLKCQTFCRHNC